MNIYEIIHKHRDFLIIVNAMAILFHAPILPDTVFNIINMTDSFLWALFRFIMFIFSLILLYLALVDKFDVKSNQQ